MNRAYFEVNDAMINEGTMFLNKGFGSVLVIMCNFSVGFDCDSFVCFMCEFSCIGCSLGVFLWLAKL